MGTHIDFSCFVLFQLKRYSFCLSPRFAHYSLWPILKGWRKAQLHHLFYQCYESSWCTTVSKAQWSLQHFPTEQLITANSPRPLHFQETTDNLPELSNQYLLLHSASSMPNRVCMPSRRLGVYCQLQA